jgi:hypothetical protein
MNTMINQIITVRLWMVIAALAGTILTTALAAISGTLLATHSISQSSATKQQVLHCTPCPICPAQETKPSKKLPYWGGNSYLPYRGGKSY